MTLTSIHLIYNHVPGKSFACQICAKKFSKKVSLDRHILIHSGEKPFACDVCGKKFTQKSQMQAHGRIHTGEKPFLCDFCGKAFQRKDALIAHRKTHTLSGLLNAGDEELEKCEIKPLICGLDGRPIYSDVKNAKVGHVDEAQMKFPIKVKFNMFQNLSMYVIR